MAVNTEQKRLYQDRPGGTFVKGNPGKPPGARHMTSRIMDAIVKVSDGEKTPEDVQLVRTLVKKAKEGDMQAMKLIFNYVDGMPIQGIEHMGKDGAPIDLNHTITFVKP